MATSSIIDTEQNRQHVAELLRDPSKARIAALELRDLYKKQRELYLQTFPTDQFTAMEIAAQLQHLDDMANVLDGKHGLAQIGSIAHELFEFAAQGKLSELTLVALGIIPIPKENPNVVAA